MIQCFENLPEWAFLNQADLSESLLMLFEAFVPRYRQKPQLLPLADQLTELWCVWVQVLQGDWYSRLHLKSAPSFWMEQRQHGGQQWMITFGFFLIYVSY